MPRVLIRIVHLAVSGLMMTAALGAQSQTEADLPAGVEQILPRGAIPAVVEPEFVSAASAEIPADAWILGLVVDGEARAYSLNLLNRHEIVNDQIGGKRFAAVW